jgi:cobalt-zinc-cadmium efflux system outer membrane protein
MKNALLIPISVLLATSCASVPRDAGVSDVRKAVSERARADVELQAQPAETDDDRVRTLLQGELTADRAVMVGVVNNPRLQVILAELGVARADLIEASTIRNPLFEAELRFPGDPFHPYELRFAQSLVDLIQLPRRRAIGRAEFDAAKLRVTGEVLRFAAGVRAEYYDLLAASQHVAAGRTILESAKAAAELAQRQHDAQNITDLELETQQAQYEEAKIELARAEQRLLLAREALIRGMGLGDAGAEWRLPSAFPELPRSEPDRMELERLAAARLDIDIARREVDIARRRVPVARLAALGEITGDVHLQRDADGARTVGPGIELPIPIFNNGEAARSRAEAQFLRARHGLNALLAESSSQLRAAQSAVAEARARVEYFRDILLPRRARIVRLTQLEHNAMLAGIFQLLQAKQNEAQAWRDYVDAQRDYWTARNDLDLAVNGVGGR